MSTNAEVLDAIKRHRDALDGLEQSAVEAMATQYREIVARQRAEFEKLLRELKELRAFDPSSITIGRIYRTERARALFIEAEAQWSAFAELIGRETDRISAQAAVRAERDASELVRAALGPVPPGVQAEVLFTRLPVQAISSIVGLTDTGPLRAILEAYGPQAAKNLAAELVNGVAAGLNPKQVASRMAGEMGANLARARTIARTEMLRAHRESARRYYERSPVVKGWSWHASLDRRTCASCWAMHGRTFEKRVPMGTHPNCRCAMVPVTYTYQELGINGPDSLESQYQPRLGVDIFARRAESLQRAVLGPKGFEAYRKGDADLADFVRQRRSRKWGVTRSRDSVKNAVEKKAARAA